MNQLGQGKPRPYQKKTSRMRLEDAGKAARAGSPQTVAQVAALTLMVVGLGMVWLLSAGTGDPLADGGRIAFVSDRDGNWEIYLMDLAGLGVARLTDTPAEEWLPAWSPDGSCIAFVSDRNGDWDIYVMDVQGALRAGGNREVTNLTRRAGRDWDPAWSPDGSRIAFSSLRDGNWEVYVMPAPGQADMDRDGGRQTDSRQRNLTQHAANDWLPTWSPDGRYIAFVSDRDDNWEIYVLEVEDALRGAGGGQTNLTRNPADDWVPAWSPDGQRIAFQSDRDGNWEVYVMRTDGSGPMNLSQHPADDWDASWAPGGRYIAFMSERDGNRELYVMPTSAPAVPVGVTVGRGVLRLTNHPAVDKNAAWSP